MTNEYRDIDILDILTSGGGAIVIASVVSGGGSLVIALPVLAALWLQHKLRRTETFEGWVDHISHPTTNAIAKQLLLPAPKEDTALTVYQNKPLDVNVVNTDRSFWDRMTNPAIGEDTSVLTGVVERNTASKQLTTLNSAIKRLPKYLSYKDLPSPPSKLAVPIGYDAVTKQMLYADFGNDLDTKILHALVAGYTGSGKDAIMRLWFATLTSNNTPEEIQFIVIDGKVDWLSPALAESAYMALPPAGGMDIQKINGKWVDCAQAKMENTFEWIFEKIQQRQQAFSKVGAVDMTSYYKKTGVKLPMLFFIASDVGETFDGQLKMLTNQLIMKGRAYGVRLIISMQNPVGEATKWRSQIGMIMSGHQPIPDHDRYVLGISVSQMQFRPSMLPNPEENAISQGLFIVRRGSSQHLVRTPHLPEDDWFTYIETIMETKREHTNQFLNTLLSEPLIPSQNKSVITYVPKAEKTTRLLLTKPQIDEIQLLIMQGKTKTEIMIDYLKATNGNTYRELSPSVDRLIEAVKLKMRQ